MAFYSYQNGLKIYPQTKSNHQPRTKFHNAKHHNMAAKKTIKDAIIKTFFYGRHQTTSKTAKAVVQNDPSIREKT